jgi:hypothetical protein
MLAVVLVFVGLLAVSTVIVTIDHGFDVLTVVSLLVLALLGFGILGALLSTPPDE